MEGSRLLVSAPGYVTRETNATVTTVDLFPEVGFDLAFYRQLARDGLQGSIVPLAVLPQAPMFYVETEGAKGFTGQMVSALEKQARQLVPLLTGRRFQVTRWETGPNPRTPEPGWIIVERYYQSDACGRATLGALAGRIRLNIDSPGCVAGMASLFAHELGHAFGFSHVDRVGTVMFPGWDHPSATDTPTDLERHHMALAYARPRDNRDIDIDPETTISTLGTRIVVD
jgi:hypothetical protein